MRMPTNNSGGTRFRGPTSSEVYNNNEDEKYLELIELYKQSNSTLFDLKEAHQTVLIENAFLHDYLKMMEDKMANLESQWASLSPGAIANARFFKTSFAQHMTEKYPKAAQDNQITSPRCQIDLQHRFATINRIHQLPKTHVVNESGKYIIPSELKVKIGRSQTKGTVIENDILNAFNGDNLSFWRRSVTYDSVADIPSDGEDVVLEIELPTRLVNNLNVNTVVVHPHPERGVQIKNVEVHYNNGWETIKGFKQNEITSLDNEEHSPRKKWYFPNVAVQKIRITLVQHHPIDVAGKLVYVLGAQEIGVYLSMFEPSGGIVLLPFEMDGLYNIESIEPVFLNRDAFSYPSNLDYLLEGNIFQYEVYSEEADKTLQPILNSNWSNQFAKKLWVKIQLYPDPSNGVTPCLHAVRLHYTKV